MEISTKRRLVVNVVQYGIGIVAIVWLFRQVEVARLVTLFDTVGLETFLGLFTVTGVGLVARFYTWQVLINRISHASLLTVAGVDLVVNFVNQLLPSRLSGRAAAPLVLRGRTGMGYAEAVAVAGVHTGLYAVLYGVVALVGIGLGVGRLPIGLLVLLVLSTGLYLVAGTFVLVAGANMGFVDRIVGVLERTARWLPVIGERLSEHVRSLPAFTEASSDWFRRLSTDPGVLFTYATGFAVAMLLAPGVRVWLLLDSFGTGFQPVFLLPVYLLVAYSVTVLPITPGGIGVSEATATAVFVALGIPAAVIVPVIFVDRFLGVYLPALAGWYPSVQLDLKGVVTE